MFFKGVLITAYNQVEIFIPRSRRTIPLPSIPNHPRVGHSLTGNMICGGLYPRTSDNCLELTSNGSGWSPLNGDLKELRLAHSSWKTPNGTVLLGGYYSGKTAELVTRTCTGGSCSISSSFKFNLQDDVR